MSNLRVFWIVWCSGWALLWMLLGFLTLVTWLLVPVSLLLILVPVGAQPRPALPACFRCGWPAQLHAGGICPAGPPATRGQLL